jgi:magnesium-transporting ATPase (P-type)
MITGDYPDTARAIAQDIRLLRPVGPVVTGTELITGTDVTKEAGVGGYPPSDPCPCGVIGNQQGAEQAPIPSAVEDMGW